MIALPVDDAATFEREAVIVPEPFGAFWVMLGCDARFVSVPDNANASPG